MASRTQIRAQQITGSIPGSGENAAVSTALVITDLKGTLDHMASAIKRIHGESTWSEGAAGQFSQDLVVAGTTPKITIGDGGAEDTMLVFDGNALDFRIGLDDGTDKLEVGVGGSHGTTPAFTIDSSAVVSFFTDVEIKGTTPSLIIGDAGAEDTKILFDGNAQDYYVGLDDSSDDLVIGLGATVGTTPALSIDETQVVTFHQDPIIAGTTPKLTIGDAGAEDTMLVFDGNAQDYRIGLDDGTDTLEIGVGSAHGTTTAITVDASQQVVVKATTGAAALGEGALAVDGGVSIAADVIVGDDVKLLSDSAVLSLGAGSDFTITHDGTTGATLAGNPITITSAGAGTWSTSSGALTLTSAAAATWSAAAGDLTLDSAAGTAILDGHTGVTLQSTNSGNILLDSVADIALDAAGGNIEFKDAGTAQLLLDMDTVGGAQLIKLLVNGDRLVFQQFDGTEVLGIEDDASLKIAGGAGSTGVTVDSSGNLTADGVIKTDSTTAATSTTDGSLQTDGGLSVALDAVVGDDLILLSDSAVIHFGADKDTTLTHTDGTGLTLNAANKLCFGDAQTHINQSADGTLSIISDNIMAFDAQGTDANDGYSFTLGADTANTTFRILNNSAADKFVVDGLGDVVVGRNLTVSGDVIVQGTTTTVSSSNMVIQDSIIGLGVSGSVDGNFPMWNNAGDRGIVFARSANLFEPLPALWWDGTNFSLASSMTSPTSQSFAAPAAADYSSLKAGHLMPGAAATYDIGSPSLEWGDVFIADDKMIKFGSDQDSTIEYDENGDNVLQIAGANVRIGHGAAQALEFRDSGLKLHSSGDGVLDLTSDATINMNVGAAGVVVKGTTPKVTIGDAGAEDTFLVFDGNTQDFRIGIKDDIDALEFGVGATHGTTAAIKILSNASVDIVTDLTVGDDLTLFSDGAVLAFGADADVTLTHSDDVGILLNSDNQLQFGDSATHIAQSADANLKLTSDGSVEMAVGAAGVKITGTTPKLTIGDAAAEDASLVFDGNAQDFYIGLDDGTDDLLIGKGNAVGTTAAIGIDENLQVIVKATTAATSTSDGALAIAGGLSVAADAIIGDDLKLLSDSAVLSLGAGSDVTLTHDGGTGLDLVSAGNLDLSSTAGSATLTVADGQTVQIGKGGASELLLEPHGTAGSELASLINTAGTTDGSDAAGAILLSSVAGGIGLAWADDKDLWMEGGQAIITANHNVAGSIKLHADAGANQTILVQNDEGAVDGTDGAGSVLLAADVGGIGIAWADGKDLWAEGGSMMFVANENKASCIQLHADAGANQTIHIVNDAGTSTTEGAAAIQLLASAGGINIKGNKDAADAILLTADGGTSGAIKIHNDQGTSVTSIEAASDAGGVKISSGMDNVASIHLVGFGMTFDGGDENDSFLFNNSPLSLEPISAPSTTTGKLYNVGGNIFFNGVQLDVSSNTSQKQVFKIGAAVAAGDALSGDSGASTFNVSTVAKADRLKLIDVHVNGQLMLSGTVAERTAGTVDYHMVDDAAASTDLKFSFALETDDVVQVVVR